MEQQDLNKRLLLALVLSFFVFIGYAYFFPATPVKNNTNQTSTSGQTTAHETPTVDATANGKAPIAAQTTQHSAPVQKIGNVLVTLRAKNFNISIDNFGRIAQMELLEKKYHLENGETLKMLDITAVKPLEIRFSDVALNDEAFNTPYTYNGSQDVSVGDTLIFTQKLSTLTVTKKMTFNDNGQYSVNVSTSSPAQFFVTPGHRPIADDSIYMLVRGALVKGADDIITAIEDGDAEGYEKFNQAKIASSFDRYVASLFYDFNNGMNVSILKENNGDPLIFITAQDNIDLNAYIGPKDHEVMKAIHPELTDAIEFGWFSFLATPFFKVLLWINSFVGNWGWSIIIFTLLVKVVLFPLSYKGMMSMQKLKDLAPKMKDIKEKYKGDPAKMNAQMMEMYKKHGANPMGGCLPLLLQIPVFFALYRVLLNAVELQGAPWILWIEDLAIMDPYFVLPVLMGVSMWFQQHITPNNFTDPLQEKIFKFFPIIMTVFFIYFPAGLVLYWLVNNLFTIAQQYFINYMYAKQKEIAIANKK
ncbi:MAG: Inner membrane protein translocase component YidC, long form [uncultured Sulfurovum sp.]|uniref:Membrane protein insertase YidC n=1 Tax=uncultured Sulfurovum sp. TaxID=269237 RepID=A0A6S6U5X8_9BACT|nr:MAG: Inner membrane protein translocase component YidC, long form [uncultured Sulfurovum sp.]